MDAEKLTALVLAAQNGEENAATALYDEYQKDLYYHIYKTVNDPHLAEDLLQDSFIEILGTIKNLKEPAAFLSWSKQIAYHRCTAYFKKRREIIADENEDGLSVFDTLEEENAEFIPDEALDKDDLKQTIHGMIAELPEEQRSALLLRYFDEMSVKEIAEIQGVTEGTVKSRLNYGRKSIKEAVEGYEKKHGVKLRCAGVIPLLLWLFREYAVSNGLSLTASGASATYTVANATTPVITEGVKAGAKATGKFAAKKLIAGVTAAAVVTGGVATAVLLKPDPDPMIWSGYGVSSITSERRFELNIDEMTDNSIDGHLKVSFLYDTKHESDFTGKGTEKDGDIVYEITFDTPAVVGSVLTKEYEQMELIYDKDEDQFTFDDIYEVEMDRHSNEPKKVLAENESWSGLGEDDFYNALKKKEHLFTLDVYKMTEDEINGNLSVSYNGEQDHKSEFKGRGYEKDGIIYYEILLETPRTEKTVINSEITLKTFEMQYDTKTETFKIPPVGYYYSVEMEKN